MTDPLFELEIILWVVCVLFGGLANLFKRDKLACACLAISSALCGLATSIVTLLDVSQWI